MFAIFFSIFLLLWFNVLAIELKIIVIKLKLLENFIIEANNEGLLWVSNEGVMRDGKVESLLIVLYMN